MRRSKIVLNSCPSIKEGVHERLLAAYASGAAVITSASSFLKTEFPSAQFYSAYKWDSVNDLISELLDDEELRRSSVREAQQTIKIQYTWDVRTHQLLEQLPALLQYT